MSCFAQMLHKHKMLEIHSISNMMMGMALKCLIFMHIEAPQGGVTVEGIGRWCSLFYLDLKIGGHYITNSYFHALDGDLEWISSFAGTTSRNEEKRAISWKWVILAKFNDLIGTLQRRDGENQHSPALDGYFQKLTNFIFYRPNSLTLNLNHHI